MQAAGQRVGHELKLGDLCAAARAGEKMLAVGLGVLERAERVGGCVCAVLTLEVGIARAHALTACQPPRCPRSFSRPRRMRPFTVPIGVSSIEAISTCVKPPK